MSALSGTLANQCKNEGTWNRPFGELDGGQFWIQDPEFFEDKVGL